MGLHLRRVLVMIGLAMLMPVLYVPFSHAGAARQATSSTAASVRAVADISSASVEPDSLWAGVR